MASRSLNIRTYCDEDFDRYVRLHVESEQLDPRGRFVSAQNLADDLKRPNFRPQTDLWVADLNGKLVGCLSVTLESGIGRALLEGLVLPLQRRKGIATALFAGAWQRVMLAGMKSAQINVRETNLAAKNLLNKLGFTFIRFFIEMQLDIERARRPAIGQGTTSSRRLRPGEEKLLTDIQNRCFADTWGFNPNTEEEITYRLNMHGRCPQDVTLTYLGDRPIGYCWTIINADENASRKTSRGWIHMLGVDPDYRQKDIGKAILSNGLEDLRARGIDIVELTVDSENPAARSLYESVGFKIYAKTVWYEKRVN
jgi:mycothiol synthase